MPARPLAMATWTRGSSILDRMYWGGPTRTAAHTLDLIVRHTITNLGIERFFLTHCTIWFADYPPLFPLLHAIPSTHLVPCRVPPNYYYFHDFLRRTPHDGPSQVYTARAFCRRFFFPPPPLAFLLCIIAPSSNHELYTRVLARIGVCFQASECIRRKVV